MRGRDRRPSWRKLLESWNRAHPERRYKSHNTLVKAFKRLAYREYNIPNYKRPKRTPYQAYRDDWVKSRKGGMG